MKINLTKANEKALIKIINNFPCEETIEDLVNEYIDFYIRTYFTNGNDYFRDDYFTK